MAAGSINTAIMPVEDIDLPATCWTENQQITYDYAVGSVLPMVKPGGTWIAPMARSPLSFIEVVECFIAIGKHPVYEGQSMTLNDREGCPVTYWPDGLIEYSMGVTA